jgi:predicted NBD/HSP70 family sugar kinase
MADEASSAAIAAHGSLNLPAVVVDSYNVEAKDEDGFIGDRANRATFSDSLEKWREPLRREGSDPFGDRPINDFSKKELEAILSKGDAEAAAIVQGAIEDFAQELAFVVRRFSKLKGWRDTERIVVGGGFSYGRVGELAIARAGAILKQEEMALDLIPIRHHPDEAGLIGAVHLAPSWIFGGHDAILAVDIGGTNIRAGVVLPGGKKGGGRSPNLAKTCVWKSELWRHGDESVKRDEAVERLIEMIEKSIRAAEREGLSLAPFVGIGCPGRIEEDGAIDRGSQNLPGNWESQSFRLPQLLRASIPAIGEHETVIVMHNDAVVQGLSEVPFMQDVARWGVLTIGTGLGNARFTNRADGADAKK